MTMVTTVIRLPEEEYQKYRIAAIKKKQSFAELVRRSLKLANPTYNQEEAERKSRKVAATILLSKGFKSDKTIRELIEEGRKY